jgi:hypothetical protein
VVCNKLLRQDIQDSPYCKHTHIFAALSFALGYGDKVAGIDEIDVPAEHWSWSAIRELLTKAKTDLRRHQQASMRATKESVMVSCNYDASRLDVVETKVDELIAEMKSHNRITEDRLLGPQMADLDPDGKDAVFRKYKDLLAESCRDKEYIAALERNQDMMQSRKTDQVMLEAVGGMIENLVNMQMHLVTMQNILEYRLGVQKAVAPPWEPETDTVDEEADGLDEKYYSEAD